MQMVVGVVGNSEGGSNDSPRPLLFMREGLSFTNKSNADRLLKVGTVDLIRRPLPCSQDQVPSRPSELERLG